MKRTMTGLAAALLLVGCAPPDGRGGSGGNGGGSVDGGNGGSGGNGGTGGGAGGSGGTGGGSGGSGGGAGGSGGGAGGSGGGAGGSGGGSGGSGGGSGGSAGSGSPDGGADVTVVPWDGGGMSCGQMTSAIAFSPKTPDVVIAFDVSGSMGKTFGSGTRYTTERDIMVPLVSTYQDKIRWGYEEFPKKNCAGGTCPDMLCATIGCADGVLVAPAFMNAMKVNAYVENKVNPSCGGGAGTPTPGALRLVRDFYKGFVDGIKERYVLLSTDGEPNQCGGNECDKSVAEITAMLGEGVKTIVLGVSEEVSASACLNRLAMAGGIPRPGGPPYFYPGSDPALLKMYLEEIITGIAKPSCVIDLTSTPPDPTKIAVFFDGVQVPWDPTHVDGWDYAPGSKTRIIIHGSYCTKLEGFMVKDIGIRFGCPPCGGTVGC